MPFSGPVEFQIRDERGRRKYTNGAERSRFLAAAELEQRSAKALCFLIAYTGCRISEALAVTNEDLDVECLTVTFRTLKRRRLVFRSVPLPVDLFNLLLDLVTNSAGRLWPIHRTNGWRIIKRVMARADIVGPMATCKGLRHGFGIRAVSCDVPMNVVQRWLGHASPATTAIYLDAVGVEERQFAARLWRECRPQVD